MAESTSQLQEKLKALTHGKVDIMLDANTFKNTTQILREMAGAWEYMTDIERASALELMGGKRQANILSSVISNFDTVESVIQTSLDSTGSAYEENMRWLDSIEGKTNQFTNSLQKFWNNLISSDTVKFVVDQGTDLMNLLDTGHGKILAIAAALKVFGKLKGISFGGAVSSLVSQIQSITGAYQSLQTLGKINQPGMPNQTVNLKAYAAAVEGLTAKQQASLLAYQGLNRAQIESVLTINKVEDAKKREALASVQAKLAKDQETASTVAYTQKSAAAVAAKLQEASASKEGATADQMKAAANVLLTTSTENLNRAYLQEALTSNGVNEALQKQIFTTLGLKSANEKTAMSVKAFAAANKQALISAGLTLLATAVTTIFNKISESIKNLKEQYDELQSSISDAQNDISAIDSEIAAVQERIDALSNKNLSLADAETLRNLKEQSAELERQKELQEKILKAREKQNSAKSVSMINNLLKTTAANQERAAESGKTWGQVLVGIAGVIGGIAIAVGTAGAGSGISAAMIGSALTYAGILGTVGATAGGFIGEKIGSSSNAADGTLIGWYNSYEEAIEKASREAAEAEQDYLIKRSDKTYKEWQEKLDQVNTLQTEMYDGLQQMQEYVGNLEYNDQTKGTIDEYNKLMAHIDVMAADGNINAQISSIEALRSEYAELSRGVDEHGNNIALTAEEYARYKTIVEQVLAYNSGLQQSYDENGNAILRAADGQYAYNQLIAESIRLLREQQRIAAAESTNDKTIDDAIKAANKAYKKEANAINWFEYRPDTINVDPSKNPHGRVGGANWSTNDVAKVISGIIGKDFNVNTGNTAQFLRDNAELIKQNRDKITAQLIKTMTEAGVSEQTIKEYVEQANIWLDDVVVKAEKLADSANAKIREILYRVPQSSEFYYDLSGEQLAFINNYIASLDDLKDKTAAEVKQIRDDLLNMMENIANNENAQEALDRLFELDPSKMSVTKYRDAVNEILNELVKEGIIKEEDVQSLFEQLVPTDESIDIMLEKVSAKLREGSKGLVENLTLPELKIAYKYALSAEDGSLSFRDLQEIINEHKTGIQGPIVQTYSTLVDNAARANEVISQTAEIVLNNTRVTQEYKDSLIELGISEVELATCFDETNNLVVTNAEKLKELTQKARKNVAENAKLAKSQARLQYYELYKQMQACLGPNGEFIDMKHEEVIALADTMSALEKTIARYSMLEAALLGAANAYDDFQEAQEMDSETDYMSKAEEMLLYLGKAFNTGKLGTESAQAAIRGLIPEDVYKDIEALGTAEEKMAAIYDYFKNGKLSRYFTFEFDEEGNITNAEMTLSNLKKFIEDGLDDNGANVFDGTDWQNFELSEDFLSGMNEWIENGGDGLDYFAKRMGVTKEVALAFIKSLEDHDIEWLDGDYSTFFDQILAGSNESQIQLYTQYLADLLDRQAELKRQLDSGEITEVEYQEKLQAIKDQRQFYETELNKAKEKSREAIFGTGDDGLVDYQIKTSTEVENSDLQSLDNWFEANMKVNQLYAEMEEAQSEYNKALTEYNKAVEDNGGAPLADDHEALVNLEKAKQAYYDIVDACSDAVAWRDKFTEPTVLEIQIALDDVKGKIEDLETKLDKKLLGMPDKDRTITIYGDNGPITKTIESTDDLLESCFHIGEDGYWEINSEVDITDLQKKYPEIIAYVNYLNSETTLTARLNSDDATVTLETLSEQIQEIIGLLEDIKISLDPFGVSEFISQLKELLGPVDLTVMLQPLGLDFADGSANADGTAHALGTAHKSGSWGLPKSEHNSLVGELGTEMVVDPHSGRYYTVGYHGAEMVDLPKDAIIFNHKQTEGLLKNGHISSRGKAYEEGNAQLTIFDNGVSGSWNNSKLNKSIEDLSDVFDWFAVKLEEINEQLDLMSSQLENAAKAVEKNSIIDSMIDKNKNELIPALQDGYDLYEAFAAKLLTKVDSKYRAGAQNGNIAIEVFAGDAGEKQREAIENYREWAQKAADLKQQLEDVNTEITSLAKQKFDNVADEFDNIISLVDSANDKLDAQVSLMEDKGYVASEHYYTKMIENANKRNEQLDAEKSALQAVLDEQVKLGHIKVGSEEWYEMVDTIHQVDLAIIECASDIEGYKNAINDIKWDNFDQLIDRIGTLHDETQNLISLLENSGDLVDEQGEWTKEGIASLGLYAQQMEIAEYQSKQYAEAIQDLKDNQDKYSESEYAEKMAELIDAQYDSIEAYYEAQDAIVDLNKTRVDAIKRGINKEIESYQELIEAKKEALDADKDIHDFQKSVMQQEKEIATIQRKLAAIANDNSMAANAKRAQLEADLAKAKAELEETYYDRSVSDQKDALDNQLDNFKEEKDAEIEKWEEYLEDIKTVVAESLGIVKDNASGVYDTLGEKAVEYGLTLSPAITTPWKDGNLAISEYQSNFDTAVSSTMDQLDLLKSSWQAVIDKMLEASRINTETQEANDANITAAYEQKPSTNTSSSQAPTQEKSITVGGQINASGAKIYSRIGGKGSNQYFASDPIYTVLEEKNGYVRVRWHKAKSGSSGWFKKSDISAYAKGTTGTKKDQLALIDELGDELVMHAAGDGRLSFLSKGSAVIPHDISENLIALGSLDPSDVLARNTPQIGVHPEIHNTEISINMNIAEVVHVDTVTHDTIPDLSKEVKKQIDGYVKQMNRDIRKYTR